jgi:hypothetical protein
MAVKWLASYLSALLQIFGITILALEAVSHTHSLRKAWLNKRNPAGSQMEQ